MDTTLLLNNLLVTGAEFLALAALFGVIAFALNWGLYAASRLPGFQRIGDVAPIQRRVRSLILLLFLLVIAALLLFNGWLTLQGERAWEATVEMVTTSLPPDFGWILARGLVGTLLLIFLARFVIRGIRRLLPRLETYVRRLDFLRLTEKQIRAFFDALSVTLRYGLGLLVATLSVRLLGLPDGIVDTVFLVFKVFLIIALGRLLVLLIAPTINTLDALSERYIRSTALDHFYTQLQTLIPLFTTALEYIIYVGAATFAVSQVDALAAFADYGEMVIRLIGIFFLARLAMEVAVLLVDRFFLVQGELTAEQWKQRLTFAPLIKSIIRYGIVAAGALLALVALGFDIGPILVGLGGIGLVVGLAAQPVTTDLISGLFILFENLFRVGDYIETNDARGVVETIDARTTRIRDSDGRLHLVRNGQIGTIINYSKGYVYAVVLVSIAHKSDLAHAFQVIEDCGQRLDVALDEVLEPTVVQGIEEMDNEGIQVRTITRVQPGRHEQAARELRRLIKEAFEREDASRALAGDATIGTPILLGIKPTPTTERKERSAADNAEPPGFLRPQDS